MFSGAMNYERVRGQAVRLARAINASSRLSSSPELDFLRAQARLLEGATASAETEFSPRTLAESILRWMSDEVSSGFSDKSAVRMELMRKFGAIFWERLMVEPPLGAFAHACAAELRARGWLEGEICELGAGSGNLSRLISESCALTRTDRHAGFLDGRWSNDEFVYDFDHKYTGTRKFTAIAAVNALHAARDKAAALSHVRSLLKPGGRLLFSEGAPWVSEGEPSAFNMLCFPFEGWIECGGFVPGEDWRHYMMEAGFRNIEVKPIHDGRFHVANLVAGLNGA